MQAYLRVVSGPDAGRTFDLKEGVKLTIGRGEKSDTRLTDQPFHGFTASSCGRAAGSCGRPGQRWRDAGRRQQDQAAYLKHGQEFQIGGTRLKLHTTGIADASTLMAAQKPARELKPDEGC